MFKTFLKMKKKVILLEGDVYIHGHQCYLQALVIGHQWPYQNRELRLVVNDFQILPGPHVGTGNNPPRLPLLNYLAHYLKPMLNSPNVWLWIVGSQFDLDMAKKFAASRLKNFEMKISTYYPSKTERLDNFSNRVVVATVRLI